MTETTKNAAYVPSSSLFAKLLSNENLTVSMNPANKTASFDPKNRVLTLPNWQGFESSAWYMFIAHEVGHALFTPDVSDTDPNYTRIRNTYKVSQSQIHAVMNVVEDIRIERKVRAKYRGLDVFFTKGYRELLSRNFFGIGDQSKLVSSGLWDKMKTLDKLNLYSKVGGLLDLKLTDANHIRWYNQALRCDTFAEVQALAEDIIKTIKVPPQPEQKPEQGKSDESSKPEGKKSEDKKDKSKDSEKSEDKSQDKSENKKSKDSKKDKSKDSKKSEDKKSKDSKKDKPEESKRTDTPGEDLEERDADDPRDREEAEPESEEGDESEEGEGEGSGSKSEEGEEGDGNESDDSDADMNGEEGDESDSDGDSEGEGSEGDTEGEGSEGDTEGESEEGESDSKGAPVKNSGPSDTYGETDLMADTQEAADKLMDKAVNTSSYAPNRYILPTDFRFLHSNDIMVEKLIKSWGASYAARTALKTAVAAYKRNSSTVLASMVSTFRANQSATMARKSQTSKTGTIDPTKLSGYKIVEDIFLRRETVTKGQNHGFVVNIDWSGSMQDTIPTVLWQTLNLIWFAETLRIPIEVYCFSDNGAGAGTDEETNRAIRARSGYGYNVFGQQIQLYSSTSNAILKADSQAHFLAMIYHFSNAFYTGYSYSIAKNIPNWNRGSLPRLPEALAENVNSVLSSMKSYSDFESAGRLPHAYLGGTPLHNAMFASIPYVLGFRVRNRVEKCVSVWLTDGSNTGRFHASHPKAVDNAGINIDASEAVFVSPLTGKEYDTTKMFAEAIPLQHHKDATGATTVVLDLARDPEGSLKRYMSRANVNAILGKNKSTRGKITILTNGMTPLESFRKSGIMVVDRKDMPTLPCDAIIATDPAAWVDGASNRYAATVTATTADSSLDATQASRLAQSVRKNQSAVAMRRFADVLVPFLAKGEV